MFAQYRLVLPLALAKLAVVQLLVIFNSGLQWV